MGDQLFTKAVLMCAESYLEDREFQFAIMLFDKVKDTKNVLKAMVQAYVDRPKPLYFTNLEMAGLPEEWEPTKRPRDEYMTLVNKMD